MVYDVYTMRLDTIHKTVNGKPIPLTCSAMPTAITARSGIAPSPNLTGYPEAEIAAIRLALEHKGDLHSIGQPPRKPRLEARSSVGAVFTLDAVAKRLGLQPRPRQLPASQTRLVASLGAGH